MKSNTAICPTCHRSISGEDAGGLCPVCILQDALGGEDVGFQVEGYAMNGLLGAGGMGREVIFPRLHKP
jgi:hypothetical protein